MTLQVSKASKPLFSGFCGLKWDKANKSTEFDVPSIGAALCDHLYFILMRANVLCFKLVGSATLLLLVSGKTFY